MADTIQQIEDFRGQQFLIEKIIEKHLDLLYTEKSERKDAYHI